MTDETNSPSPRQDGWTPARQRVFLETLAMEGMVRRAARAAGMSHEAAYQLRHRPDGAAFRLGWEAALLLARAPIADLLMERAIDGQEDVIVRDHDGRTRTRHDNRLALALLSRLDRFADDNHVAHADARIVAGAWDAFVQLIEKGGGRAALDEFLAAQRPSGPEENNADGPCQLPWLAEEAIDLDQWLRDAYVVWWSEEHGGYRTNFPPPPGFSGDQQGNLDEGQRLASDYVRSLSSLEAERHVEYVKSEADELRARSQDLRRQWFGIENWEEADAPCSDAMAAVS